MWIGIVSFIVAMVVVVVVAPGSASATTTVASIYDRDVGVGADSPATSEETRDPVESGGGAASRRYDPATNTARTSARPAGEILAPQTGGGDQCDPCPVPQGTIRSYGSLRFANAGHPECNAHHIIQHAAVREVDGYNRDAAPAIVLHGPPNVAGTPHDNATQAQRSAAIAGTYGDERQVAVSALVAAGVPQAVIHAALAEADGYFIGQLGLSYSSPTRPPGDRWGYGG